MSAIAVVRQWLVSAFRRLLRRGAGPGDEFVDVDLPIESHAVSADGVHVIVARGTFAGTPVAVQVEIGATWEEWPLEEHGITLWRGRVAYVSVGEESDAFVRVLATLYGLGDRARAMRPRTELTAIALSGNPMHTLGAGVRIKCFFEAEEDERYAEFFTNVSLDNGQFEFHEKDFGYRRPLLRALTERDGAYPSAP